MLKQKDIDLQKLNRRKDYQQILVLRNFDDQDMLNLISDELMQEEGGDTYNFKRIEKLGSQIERYGNHTVKLLETIDFNIENILSSNTIEDLNNACVQFKI